MVEGIMRSSTMLHAAVLLAIAAACSSKSSTPPLPVSSNGGEASACLDELPLQSKRGHALGETFYLPNPKTGEACVSNIEWRVELAPTGSLAKIYAEGAAHPRITPDLPGQYVFRGQGGASLNLDVVARTPAERFRNHYLTPLYGATVVGNEVWVANGSSYTVTRVAVEGETLKVIGDVTVGAWPGAVAWSEPMPYAVVAQRGSDTLGFIDRARGVLEDALWVGDEPAGVVVSPGGKRAYVTLATEHAVAVVDLEARRVLKRIEVGFDPRAIVLSPDGTRLFVASYRSGNLSDGPGKVRAAEADQDVFIIDIAEERVSRTVYSVAADLRAIALDRDELFVAATDGDPIPSQSDATAKPFVHLVASLWIDPANTDYAMVRRSADLTRQVTSKGPAVGPSGILVDGETVWVSAESSDDVLLLDRKTLEERARVRVGRGPRALVKVPGGIAVHCFQSFELWVLAFDGTVRQTLKLTSDPRPPAVALGETVFTRPGGGWASNEACSSCHVETQTDTMVWRFGQKIWNNVRPLQLLAATTPVGWGAYVSSVANFGFQGPASIVNRPATTLEANGLAAFLDSLLGAPRATGHTRLDGSYTEEGARGKELFEGKARCGTCHAPPLYTTREVVEKGKSGEPADVPSLLGVYRHGAWLVKGQARSLEAAVDVAAKYAESPVNDSEKAAIVRFLRELTPKGSAPLGIFPDRDSSDGVANTVQPSVAFADAVDGDSEVAAKFVVLERDNGTLVPTKPRVEGGRIVLEPGAPLDAGGTYVFRARAGLPFATGGALEAERSIRFVVSRPAMASLPDTMHLVVHAAIPTSGGPPKPLDLTFAVTAGETTPSGPSIVIKLGDDQEQRLLVRLDGERVLLAPFALPLGRGVADATRVSGAAREVANGTLAKAEGTLTIGGPGLAIPNVRWELIAGPPPPPATP
jgi:DNA-binding beta-propeller fold protein YncE